MKLLITDRAGSTHEIEPPDDVTLMEAIRDSGVDDILALCGGCCSCATCHVYVDAAFDSVLPTMSDDEAIMLDTSEHRQASSRLSCQVPLKPELDGLRVTIAPED